MKPLEGTKVVDLTAYLTGPFCTQILGDLGAEVIKVERPGVGDNIRTYPPIVDDKRSAYFVSINRNKKSIALNLKSEEGKEIIKELLSDADVFIENLAMGKTDDLGIDYDSVKEFNDEIIYCSIKGYGEGPYAGRKAYDMIIQAEAGLSSISGMEEGPPIRIPNSPTDLYGGSDAAIAIMAALLNKQMTGEGQFIEISMMDSTIARLVYFIPNYSATGEEPEKWGKSHPNIVPYQFLKTKDSYIAIAGATPNQWAGVCKSIEREDLIDHPDFNTAEKRVENRDELEEILEEKVKQKNTEEWMEIFSKNGVPVGKVRKISELLEDPHVNHRNIIKSLETDQGKEIQFAGPQINFSGSKCKIDRDVPKLGEDSEEVLADLGYSEEEIEDLKGKEVIE